MAKKLKEKRLRINPPPSVVNKKNMKTQDKIIIWVFWVVLLIMLTAVLIKVEPKVITKEVKQECPIQTSYSETVWFLDKNTISKLPFCALVSEESDGYCYDWYGTSGVSIIKIKDFGK